MVLHTLTAKQVGNTFINNSPDWNIEIMDGVSHVATIVYFTVTSLSTVGFGDYYPITDPERVLCSFILLFGVASFSYTMGQLTDVLYNTVNDFEDNDENDLDGFFALLKYLNKSEPIHK